MNPRAIGLSVAGLLVAGGVIAGATGAQADTIGPPVESPSAADGVMSARSAGIVTGIERERVTAAVHQQDQGVIVHAVRRAADGTFHVLGAKAGEPVLAEVSRTFQRVTVQERPTG